MFQELDKENRKSLNLLFIMNLFLLQSLFLSGFDQFQKAGFTRVLTGFSKRLKRYILLHVNAIIKFVAIITEDHLICEININYSIRLVL